jgi:site-specific DNA recombinase
MSKNEVPRDKPRLQCAIYTRKSSEEGLEQEFNSLDAQREACAAYIQSQRHAGWLALPDMYDDGGLSGGTMGRPALQRLLDNVRAGKVNVIVVYKVDRLTRSLADFAKIVDVLDAHNASFVSVTQHFNTTTSMGRLTLNVLLSFAQFEREIAGERIRDKIAASKKKGMWMGGSVPLGYDVVQRKLVVNPTEAETVGSIFARYADLGTVSALQPELRRKGILSKSRKDASGRCSGGRTITRGALYFMLRNRIYRGEIVHRGSAYPGEHEAIIDAELWERVQQKLDANRRAHDLGVGMGEPSLLAGLIVDSDGERMTPTHAVKSGKRYRYYVSNTLITGPKGAAPRGRRIPAGEIEPLVVDRLRTLFASAREVSDALSVFELTAGDQKRAIYRADELSQTWSAQSPTEQRALVRSVLTEIAVHPESILLTASRSEVRKSLLGEGKAQLAARKLSAEEDRVTLAIEAELKRAGRGVRLVVGDGAAEKPDACMVNVIAKAFEVSRQLFSGQYTSIEDMADRTGTSRTYVTSLVRLTYLSPAIVRAILDGGQPIDLSMTRLMTATQDLPHDWAEQQRYLGFPSA